MDSSPSSGKRKLSYFQFIMTIFLLTSAGPFGFEYVVVAVGVGYTLLFVTLFAIFYCFPIALIASELAGLMPSNHGQIVWPYRAFSLIHPSFGDFVGFLNAANSVVFWTLTTATVPIIFCAYLETITGSLSYGVSYAIRLCVILSGLILNIFEFSMISYITTFFCCAMLVPLWIAFFWTLPEIDISTQWFTSCSSLDWSLAITTLIWEFSGFMGLGNLIGEIGFDPKHLYSAYIFGVALDAAMLYIPVIAAATQSTDECNWYDGYFADAFISLSSGLRWTICIGAIVLNWCIYVNSMGVSSRMLWAMSQPYFEILHDGSMLVPKSNDSFIGHTQVAINIFPQQIFGSESKKTGAPIGAVIILSIFIAVCNLSLSFADLVEFNLFSYFVFFSCIMVSYLILKHNEPNAPRAFEIPYGLKGGYIVSITLIITLGICFGVLIVDNYDLIGYACIMNLGFVFYYFIAKKFLGRMHQDSILPQKEEEDEYLYQEINHNINHNKDSPLHSSDDENEKTELQPLL